jgi:hypothetical protein
LEIRTWVHSLTPGPRDQNGLLASARPWSPGREHPWSWEAREFRESHRFDQGDRSFHAIAEISRALLLGRQRAADAKALDLEGRSTNESRRVMKVSAPVGRSEAITWTSFTGRLPAPLHRDAQDLALTFNLSLNELLVDGIESFVRAQLEKNEIASALERMRAARAVTLFNKAPRGAGR